MSGYRQRLLHLMTAAPASVNGSHLRDMNDAMTVWTATYSDGAPIRLGDAVLVEKGAKKATVIEIITSVEDRRAQGVESPGLVLDIWPTGLVFLSTQLLREDPPRLVGRGLSAVTLLRMKNHWLFLAGVLLLPALWSFASAVYSAISTGEVMVISLERTSTYRRMVPWQVGWSRFVGPALIVLGLSIDARVGRSRNWWWLPAVVAGLGVSMLVLSAWFTTLKGQLWYAGILAFIAACYYIDVRFGRFAAFIFMVAGVVALFIGAIS